MNPVCIHQNTDAIASTDSTALSTAPSIESLQKKIALLENVIGENELENRLEVHRKFRVVLTKLFHILLEHFRQDDEDVRQSSDSLGIEGYSLTFFDENYFGTGTDDDGLNQVYSWASKEELRSCNFFRHFGHNCPKACDEMLVLESHLLELVSFLLRIYRQRTENDLWDELKKCITNDTPTFTVVQIEFRINFRFLNDFYKRQSGVHFQKKLSMENYSESYNILLPSYLTHPGFLKKAWQLCAKDHKKELETNGVCLQEQKELSILLHLPHEDAKWTYTVNIDFTKDNIHQFTDGTISCFEQQGINEVIDTNFDEMRITQDDLLRLLKDFFIRIESNLPTFRHATSFGPNGSVQIDIYLIPFMSRKRKSKQ